MVSLTHYLEKHKSLVIINVYRPVRSTNYGSVYQQHKRFYQTHNKHYKDPLTTYDKDLMNHIQQFLNKNYEVMLLIDANEPVQHTSSFHNLMTHINLKDAIASNHQADPTQPPTHSHKTKCIDLIYVTQTLLPYINNQGLFSTKKDTQVTILVYILIST